jgi:hypothetical protein
VHAEIALDAVAPAAVGAAHGELVAGLGIAAEATEDLRAEAAGKLEPCRLLGQENLVGTEHRGRLGAPVTPGHARPFTACARRTPRRPAAPKIPLATAFVITSNAGLAAVQAERWPVGFPSWAFRETFVALTTLIMTTTSAASQVMAR